MDSLCLTTDRFCAEQVHPGEYLNRYAVLGDDVVIAEVASVYETALAEIQENNKSFISCAEFARVRDFSKDLSLLPVFIKLKRK